MKFVIDCNKWICGNPHYPVLPGDVNCRLGSGSTRMLNRFGYMCCLGQVCGQLGFTEEQMMELGEPHEVFCSGYKPQINFLCEKGEEDGEEYFINSAFSVKAMEINDATTTTVREKIDLLTAHFKEAGHELEFINIPEFKGW